MHSLFNSGTYTMDLPKDSDAKSQAAQVRHIGFKLFFRSHVIYIFARLVGAGKAPGPGGSKG